MEPVSYIDQRAPWSAPSIIGPAPHNLPSRPNPTTVQQPFIPDTVAVREVYRYASLQDLQVTVGTTSFKFLDAPIGKRNMLGFRNASTSQTIYIGFGRDATTNSWLALSPGTIILFDTVCPQDDLYAVASAAGATLAYIYSTFQG
jgi:hypothetical protein